VNGHEIEIVYCNNLADVNKAKECARQAVEEDVTAVVGHIDIWSNESLPILEQGGIPDVGFWSNGLPVDFESDITFPLHSGTVAGYVALPFAAKKEGKTKIATADTNIPSAIANAKIVEYAAKKAGIEYVGNVEIPESGSTDASSFAQELKEMGAEAVANIISTPQQVGLLKASKSLGYAPLWMNIAQAAGEKEAKEVEGLYEGALLSSPFPSVRDTSSELVSQFNEEMKEQEGIDPIEAGVTTQQSWDVQMNAWLGVHAVAAVAEGIEGEITSASLKEAIESAKEVALPGGFEWHPGEEGPPDYPNVTNWDQYLLQFKGGKLETLPGEPIDTESALPPLASE
jgi:ABC-type branched-subunit amino acid transport system substrate-binding protein